LSGNKVMVYADLILDSDVDHNALQRAAELVMQRYPYFAVKVALSDEGDRYILETNDRPFTVIKKNGYVTESSGDTNDYLLGISHYNEHILISVFHGLTDGFGLKILSQAIIQGYFECLEGREFSGEADLHGSPSEEEWEDPFKHTVEIENVFKLKNRKTEILDADNYDDSTARVYSFTVPEDVVVNYAKKDEGSVSGLISLALARTLDIMEPDNNVTVHVACPMNIRGILGCDRTLRNCTKSARYELTPELRNKPQNVQLSCLKAQMLIQSSEEYQMPRYYEDKKELTRLYSIDSIEGKKDFFRKGALKAEPIISYLGKIDFGELNDRVKDVFIYGKVMGCTGIQSVCVCFKNRCRICASYNFRYIGFLKMFVNELLDFCYESSPLVRIDYESPANPVEVANYAEKYFSVKDGVMNVRCKMFVPFREKVRHVVIAGHGFAGHKESRAISNFADTLMFKNRNSVVIAYDLPGHGEDMGTSLRLKTCGEYLTAVKSYAEQNYPEAKIYYYGTSFGGYLGLRYAEKHNMPFEKMALRCPAVNMYETLNKKIITEEMRKSLNEKGFCLSGFDVLIRLDGEFIDELKESSVYNLDYSGMAEKLLIIQGTADELVDCGEVVSFSERNGIRHIISEGADHRFIDGNKMRKAIDDIIEFFGI